MSNVQEPVDYYGNMDDVAICHFTKAEDSDIHSALEGVTQIDTPINGRIEKVVWLMKTSKSLKTERKRMMYG